MYFDGIFSFYRPQAGKQFKFKTIKIYKKILIIIKQHKKLQQLLILLLKNNKN